MENFGKVDNLTANQKLNGDVTFDVRCFHRPEIEFRHYLTNEKSRITSKRTHLQRKHVKNTYTNSRSPNRLVTFPLFCDAVIEFRHDLTNENRQ
jgi:hypothetical protein